MPSNPQLMLLRSNQPTLLAIGLAALAGTSASHLGRHDLGNVDQRLARLRIEQRAHSEIVHTGLREISRGDEIEQADAPAGDHARNRAGRGGAFPPDAHHERREIARHRERERPAHHGQNIAWLGRCESSRDHGDERTAACGRPSAAASSARSDRSSCSRCRARARWRWPAAGRRRSRARRQVRRPRPDPRSRTAGPRFPASTARSRPY